MIYLRITVATAVLALATIANGETTSSVTSESRDASTAYLGTSNFVVGRIGRDCLTLLNRPETPQAFVLAWQQRNAKYLMASQKYMGARLEEAEASGGAEKRNSVMSELTAVVKNGAESIVKSWLDRPDKNEACKFAVSLIESGAYDVSSTSPIFSELEGLVSWAQH
ncbi:MAG: hypothetical protein WC009_11440 [Methylotenera sp.]